MREIKFRAWDTQLKKMLFFPIGKDPADCYEVSTYDALNNVMQFTGLHDKNGKEIYESDLIKVGDEIYQIVYSILDGGYVPFITTLHKSSTTIQSSGCPIRDWNWLDGGKAINWHKGGTDKVEVIGNLYENPDLLNN